MSNSIGNNLDISSTDDANSFMIFQNEELFLREISATKIKNSDFINDFQANNQSGFKEKYEEIYNEEINLSKNIQNELHLNYIETKESLGIFENLEKSQNLVNQPIFKSFEFSQNQDLDYSNKLFERMNDYDMDNNEIQVVLNLENSEEEYPKKKKKIKSKKSENLEGKFDLLIPKKTNEQSKSKEKNSKKLKSKTNTVCEESEIKSNENKTIKRKNKKRKIESAKVIEVCPSYELFSEENLKENMRKYGMKPGRSNFMIKTLQDIFKFKTQAILPQNLENELDTFLEAKLNFHSQSANNSKSKTFENIFSQNSENSNSMKGLNDMKKQKIVSIIKQNKEFYSKILKFEKIDIIKIKEVLNKSGIIIETSILKEFLLEKGINVC